ncbi:uncharacterized protein [Onthophagus taurus]|uniref:uncharacterized protein n=1 Tax=Onthophagus taurus TaxID=166361 RepID=UPI0039BE3B02
MNLLILFLIPLVTSLPQSSPGQTYTKLSEEQIKHLQNRGFGPTASTAFRPTSNYEDDKEEELEEDDDTEVASSQARVPIYSDDNYPVQNTIPVQQRPQNRPQTQIVQRKPPQYRPQYGDVGQEVDGKKKDEKEEEEEPDRLSILLPQTKFNCQGRNTGYYADEELGCEVFHYCQDNARHSWICPEGFTFHQVHLICMPPGGDNICEKSSQFHFVNEYLYRPINLQEHQSKPNVTLKYSDRYYPENYYSYDEDDEPQRPRQQVKEEQRQVIVRRPTLRPETTIGQVYRNPEEINISLQQRRPQYVTQRYNVEY